MDRTSGQAEHIARYFFINSTSGICFEKSMGDGGMGPGFSTYVHAVHLFSLVACLGCGGVTQRGKAADIISEYTVLMGGGGITI